VRELKKVPSKTLNNTYGSGYLNQLGNGKYSINAVGENLIAIGLTEGKLPKKRTIKKKRKTRK